jgi:repressor LexA
VADGLTDPAAAGEAPPVALTERQRAILEVIQQHVDAHGYPPSVREICDAVGLKSTSSVHAQLATLEEKGFLRRDHTKPRALEVARDLETDLELRPEQTRNVPFVGEIAAGAPIIAEERVDAVYPLPRDLVGEGTLFMLQVRGESMLDAGILPGDYVVVREQPTVEQGEMCAALVDGEATVKFFRRTRAGEVFLDPANERYEPIAVAADADARIMGKVVSVLRTIR